MNPHYQSYLIRFHQRAGEAHWRATLEDAASGETLRFATELDLLRYVLRQLAQKGLAPPEPLPNRGESVQDKK